MATITAADLLEYLGDRVAGVAGATDRPVDHAASLSGARTAGAVTFCALPADTGREAIAACPAGVVLCGRHHLDDPPPGERTLIALENPRLAFVEVVGRWFAPEPPPAGIAASARVHPDAAVDPSAHVGELVVLGRCSVGANSVLHPGVVVYDGVTIGANCIVHANTVIGATGFGYERAPDGRMIPFPHLGGVEIGNGVEIGSCTTIDRGTLDATVLSDGVKVDNGVHIAHNVRVGKDSVVIAHAMIAGSVRIGERVWIAPSAATLETRTIGDDATVGLGAVLTKNVPAGATYVGAPARPLDEFRALMKRLSELT